MGMRPAESMKSAEAGPTPSREGPPSVPPPAFPLPPPQAEMPTPRPGASAAAGWGGADVGAGDGVTGAAPELLEGRHALAGIAAGNLGGSAAHWRGGARGHHHQDG